MIPLTLVFETSTPHGSLALVDPQGLLEQRIFTSDRSHNAVLFSPLQELLERRGQRSIERVIVGSGPGSYSGTRVGIATAQGVAIAFDCPAVAVPSILAVTSVSGGGPCLAIGDARRGSFWTAMLDQQKLVSAPELVDAAGLQIKVTAALAGAAVVFSFEQPSRFPLAAEVLELVQLEYPNAERLWQAWLAADESSRVSWSRKIPQPGYLKPPHITPPKRSRALGDVPS
jgi:tRNA threonylcarbamoyladenosine biosynthesis protein TsaB